ncbi:protein of uncharacterised function DUF932 [Enterobacter asburiae]|uniref:Protein of uncharacterized function DUF932 n=1 Tax=Enterobacter asburiae TaxID=61645 RepID=A0A376FAE2_ENTAS|nr:protein of uncharacterised function DUF932 [Enterobacter asburiae]
MKCWVFLTVWKRSGDAMQSLMLPPPAQQALAQAALTYRFGEDHQPVTAPQILSPRRWQDESNDLWTTYQRIQENLIKGGLSGRSAKRRANAYPRRAWYRRRCEAQPGSLGDG